MNSTSNIFWSVYLSCFDKSFSKKAFTFLTNLNLAFNWSGLKPSAYIILLFNNSFKRALASLNMGENIAATAYLYQTIILA